MDDKFFAAVARRLKEIEAENASRYARRRPDEDEQLLQELYCHPFLVNSIYWQRSDSLATPEDFDWDRQSFPRDYLIGLRAHSAPQIHRAASLAYRCQVRGISALQATNTGVMIARMMALKVTNLLELYI